MKKNWNLPALLLVLAMLVALFSGCGGSAAPAASSIEMFFFILHPPVDSLQSDC